MSAIYSHSFLIMSQRDACFRFGLPGSLAVFSASCGFLMQMLGFPKQVLLNKELYYPGSPKEPDSTFKQEQSTVYKEAVRDRYPIKDKALTATHP